MDDDSLLPNEEMEKMRREIDVLKRRQGITDENTDVKSSMINLSRSINSLIRIFKEASDDMKMDTHDAVLVTQKLDKLVERLDRIEVQNEKIAKGIVALADMVEELQSKYSNRPMVQRMPSPVQQTHQVGPRPLPTYALPPEEEKKKNFLNFKL